MNRLTFELVRLGNKLYEKHYRWYRPLYFLYKRWTERQSIFTIRSAVTEGMVVVDAGANIGFYTRLLSDLVGIKGCVHAFEPDPDNFNRLKENLSIRKNVVLHKSALSDTTGSIRLFRSNALNVDHQTYDSGEGRASIEVACFRLDDYFRNEEKINFLKIDLQGFDFRALQGMIQTIRRSPHVQIWGEYWPLGLQNAGAEPESYIEQLQNLGFILQFFPPDTKVNNLKMSPHSYASFLAKKG